MQAGNLNFGQIIFPIRDGRWDHFFGSRVYPLASACFIGAVRSEH